MNFNFTHQFKIDCNADPLTSAVVGGLLFSQVITLLITPVIYLYLDRFSGKGLLKLAGDEAKSAAL